MNTQEQLLFSKKTPSGEIEVWQNGTVRYLYMQDKVAIQSQIDMAQKQKLLLQHSRAMMSFLLFQPNPKSVLLFGIGGGSIIHFLHHWFPTLNITAIDNNENIIDIAKKYFAVSPSPQIDIQLDDAFHYLSKSLSQPLSQSLSQSLSKAQRKKVSTILIDIHDGKSIPDFLHDPDFIAQCFQSLSSKGILVINLLINDDHDFLRIMTAVRQHFTDISLCMTLKNHKNILLFAFKSLKTFNNDQLRTKAKQYQQKYGIEFDQFIDDIVVVDVKK